MTSTTIKPLSDSIQSMGQFVEKAIDHALRGLLKKEPERLQDVFQIENRINQAQMINDEICFGLLSKAGIQADELRHVIAMIKINTDLERMGDQAVNIAQNAFHCLNGPSLKSLIDIHLMSLEVQKVVRNALNSFVSKDLDLARNVLQNDDVIDGMKAKISSDVLQTLQKDPSLMEYGFDLILIARNLERLADHATNIAEDVIFAFTGEDVRHSHK